MSVEAQVAAEVEEPEAADIDNCLHGGVSTMTSFKPAAFSLCSASEEVTFGKLAANARCACSCFAARGKYSGQLTDCVVC